MNQVWDIALRVAPLASTVLITGETGVGKERLARFLHHASPRATRPFVAVNCAALSDSLLESELFGYVRGAFTGALSDRIGLLEAANGGTVFLDEIGDVSAPLQVKLLRVLQEREIRRLGETRVRPIDIRVIVATHRNLWHEVEVGRFRADLHYRLRVIDLELPPLRERLEDLREIANEILQNTASRLGRPVLTFGVGVLERLLTYPWPGNIRELEHAIERACAFAVGSTIELDDLPPHIRMAVGASPQKGRPPFRVRQRAYALAVLAQHHGNRTAAAMELGISKSTLKRYLRADRADGV
jgi:transcriptional regulator with PAS, ATPase and Fis domain